MKTRQLPKFCNKFSGFWILNNFWIAVWQLLIDQKKVLRLLDRSKINQDWLKADDVSWWHQVMTCARWCHPKANMEQHLTGSGAWTLGTGACSACETMVVSGGTWSACLIVKSFRKRVWACVQSFLAVHGWVLLVIGCFVMLCLFFGSLMNKMMRSESCRNCGCDDSNLLLTVATGWKRGQRKSAEDDHKNQNVKAMVLITC